MYIYTYNLNTFKAIIQLLGKSFKISNMTYLKLVGNKITYCLSHS